MSTSQDRNVGRVRSNFENREAIYVEKGALRVRVKNVRAGSCARSIAAEVEEIHTPGLGVEMYSSRGSAVADPLRWKVEAGYLTTFSEHTWAMGYGGWEMFFAPRIVHGVIELAASWNESVDSYERYNQVLACLADCNAYEPENRVFPE